MSKPTSGPLGSSKFNLRFAGYRPTRAVGRDWRTTRSTFNAAWRTRLGLSSGLECRRRHFSKASEILYNPQAPGRVRRLHRLLARFSTARTPRGPAPISLKLPSSRFRRCRCGQVFYETPKLRLYLVRPRGMPLLAHTPDRGRTCCWRMGRVLTLLRKRVEEHPAHETDCFDPGLIAPEWLGAIAVAFGFRAGSVSLSPGREPRSAPYHRPPQVRAPRRPQLPEEAVPQLLPERWLLDWERWWRGCRAARKLTCNMSAS